VFGEHIKDLAAGGGHERTTSSCGASSSVGVEANGLQCGGGGQGAAWEFCVQLAGRGSPTEAQRLAVGTWLSQQAEVRAYELGDLFDGWHGPDEAPYAGSQVRRGEKREGVAE
jgi:hypothetical protein